MATLILNKVFINLLATGESVSAATQEGRTARYAVRGDVRIAAGGRSRAFRQEGTTGTYSFTLQDVTRAQIDKLQLWAGKTVQVRDDRGRLFHGVYWEVPESEHRANESTLYDVAIALATVTVDLTV